MNPTDGGAHAYDDRPPAPHGRPELHNETVAHEHSDINVRGVIMFAVGLIVVAAIVHVAMWLLFGTLERKAVRNDPAVSPVAAPDVVMPKTTRQSPFFGGAAGPQLVTDEPKLLQMLRGRENQDLHTYGWVDQQGGVARIPIEEAEKLLLQRGLPVRPAGQEPPPLGMHPQSLGESSSGRGIPLVKQSPGYAQAPATAAEPAPGSTQEPGTRGQSIGRPGEAVPTTAPRKPGGAPGP
jgi:hypothetical protein